MRRTLGLAVLVTVGLAVASLLLTLLMTGFTLWFLLLTKTLGLQHALGMDTQTSHNYATVSGVGPMMITVLGFSGILVTAWKHLNCQEPGCPRPGHRRPNGRIECHKHHAASAA